MKEILRLTRLFLTSHYSLSMLRYNFVCDRKAFYKQVAAPVIVLICLVPLYGLYWMLCVGLFAGLTAINQASVLLPAAYTAISAIVIIFGIAHVLSEFFFSDNVSMLMPMPLRQTSILAGKYLTMMIGEWALSIIFMLPPAVIFGIGTSAGLLYGIKIAIIMLLLPMLPIALETAVLLVLMRASFFNGRQDVIQTIGLFVLLGIILGVEVILNTQLNNSDDPTVFINAMLADGGILLEQVGTLYPPARLIGLVFGGSIIPSILSLIALVAVTALAIWLMLWAGKRFYFKSLMDNRQSSGGKKLSKGQMDKGLSGSGSKALAVFRMDIRLLIRTPIYFYNNVSVVIILPIIMVVMFLTSGGFENMLEIRQLASIAPDAVNAILVGGFLFYGMTTATTASTFSREGKNSWLSRIVPVPARDQIIGRTLSAVCILTLGIVITMVLVQFVMPMNVVSIVVVVVLSLIGSLPIFLIGLLIDMHRPLLDWENPQKAVKNNMNVFLVMLAGLGWMVVSIGLSVVFALFIMPIMGYVVFILLSIGASVGTFIPAERQLLSCLRKMEE